MPRPHYMPEGPVLDVWSESRGFCVGFREARHWGDGSFYLVPDEEPARFNTLPEAEWFRHVLLLAGVMQLPRSA